MLHYMCKKENRKEKKQKTRGCRWRQIFKTHQDLDKHVKDAENKEIASADNKIKIYEIEVNTKKEELRNLYN